MIDKRTTLPLLLLFLALLAAFLWQQQSGRNEPEPPLVPTLESAVPLFPNQSLFTLHEVTVQRSADGATVRLTHDGQGSFTLVDPTAAAADSVLVLEQLGALVSSGSRRTLTGNLSDFGLDTPTHTITVEFETAVIPLTVGNLAPNQTQIYVLRDSDILLLQTAVIQPLLDWIENPPIV